MDVTLEFIDGTTETFNIFTYDPYEVCDYILSSKEMRRKQITKVKIKEVYVKNPPYDANDDDGHPRPKEPSLEDLQSLVRKYQQYIDTKIEVKDVNQFIFNIEMEGNIFDIIGLIKGLKLHDEFCRYRTYLNNDINIINLLLRGTDVRNVDTKRSLILRFLSERHCNLNQQQIFDILRHDIAKKDLTDYVTIVFYKVHGIKIDEAKEIEEKTDKLSIKSILNSKIKELDDEIARRLVPPRQREPPVRVANEEVVRINWIGEDVDL